MKIGTRVRLNWRLLLVDATPAEVRALAGDDQQRERALLALRAEVQDAFAAEVEQQRAMLREVENAPTGAALDAAAEKLARQAFRDRTIAAGAVKADNSRRAAKAGEGNKLDLTWGQVRPKWERHFRYFGEAGPADKATANDFSCSWRAIQNLRLAAGAGTKKR